jgi:glycosyltransferase involved in cell wall biosynthesis
MADSSPSHLTVILLLRSLEVGGAERQAVQLAIAMHRQGISVRVAVFYRRGPFAEALEHEGVEIIDLEKRSRWDIIRFVFRAGRLIRRTRAGILYSFLGGANIVAAIVGFAIPGLRVVWSIRSSDVDLSRYDWVYRLGYWIERILASRPKLIIANSAAGRNFAVRHGFPGRLITVVPNGIDTLRFKPDPALRARFRKELRLSDDKVVIGVLARLDSTKDYPTFLRAGTLVAARRQDVVLACVGEGREEPSLKALVTELGIVEQTLFIGPADAPAALNAFDVACSASITEGFPNAVAEAMACGKPCVVTDVGDCALIVGDCGSVVRPCDPQGLASAILNELERRSPARSAAARRRIVDNFSLSRMVERTVDALVDVMRCRALTNEHGLGSSPACAE